jgi:hypothetical protein
MATLYSTDPLSRSVPEPVVFAGDPDVQPRRARRTVGRAAALLLVVVALAVLAAAVF